MQTVECKVWDFPRAWQGRGVTHIRHELKLLSLNIPDYQMTGAVVPSEPAALERTRTCVRWKTGQLPGLEAGRQKALQLLRLRQAKILSLQVQGSGSRSLSPQPQEAEGSARGSVP